MKSDGEARSVSTDLFSRFGTLRYGLAICLGLVSACVWIWVGSYGVTDPFLSFFASVFPVSVACASVFGWRAGWLAAAVAGMFGWFVILPPEMSFALADGVEIAYLVVVLSCSALASIYVGSKGRLG